MRQEEILRSLGGLELAAIFGLGAFVFGGVATSIEGRQAWVAVEVVFNGVVIDSCYGTAVAGEAAVCEGNGQAFAPSSWPCFQRL